MTGDMKMKRILLAAAIVACGAGTGIGADLKPIVLPEGAMIDTSQKATHAVVQAGLTNNTYGIRSTDYVTTVSFFRLGFDVEPFGKKGDRVWQVHQIEQAAVRVIAWVNAETGSVKFLFPKEEKTPNHTSDGIRQPANGLPKPSR